MVSEIDHDRLLSNSVFTTNLPLDGTRTDILYVGMVYILTSLNNKKDQNEESLCPGLDSNCAPIEYKQKRLGGECKDRGWGVVLFGGTYTCTEI
jgi:hypothetical protein